jgi:predicted Zn-dependent protease
VRDIDRAARRAVEKAQRSVGPQPLAPGKYVTALEPACRQPDATLALSLAQRRQLFPARGKTKLGQQLFHESISIRSDPSAPVAPGAPFSDDGQVQRPQAWIDRGRLSTLWCERFWAAERGHEALPPPSNLLMSGGSGSLEQLIASTERGVLITSL